MATARLVTCGLLLAAGVPAAAGRPLLQDTSGELSGAGDPDSERWGDAGPTRWSRPPPLLGAVTEVPVPPWPWGADDPLQALGTVATLASAGTGAWRDGDPAPDVVEEPFIAWRGREAKGQAGRRIETRMPSAVPTDVGPGSPGPAGPGHGPSLVGTASPRPTVSTIALRPVPGAAVAVGTAKASVRGAGGQLASTVPLGPSTGPPRWVPVPQPTHAEPPRGPRAGPGSTAAPSSVLPLSAKPAAPGPPGWALGAAGQAAPEGRAETWTPGLSAHQRSTRRAPLGNTTAGHAAPRADAMPTGTPPPRATAGPALGTGPAAPPAPGTAAPGTLRAGTVPEEELGSPQRVRGAVSPPNATEEAVPATGTPGPRRSDTTGTRPPGPSTAAPSSTWRRGLIRVTTQRALPRPAAPEREPSAPPTAPVPSAPCPPAGGACSAPRGNGTGPRWAELRRTLSLAWDAHVYGSAALFLLLSLGCLAALLGAPALRPPHLPHVLVAHGLLLATGALRAAFLLLDPYGARGRLPPRAVLLLATAPFPLLLAAFAVLLQRLQRLAQLRLLPPQLRSLPALGAAAALQSGALGAADLLSPRLSPAVGLALHALSCAAGALLLLAGLRACWRVLRGPGGSGGSGEAPGLRRGARALAAAAALGLPCCGLQLYSALWLWGTLGPPGRFSWPCWAAQLWLRAGELAVALALLAAAAEPLCRRSHRRRGGAAGHSCWAKALRYFCASRKAAAPEYPNNCYDWAGAGPERPPASDISKSLIRNPAEQLPLRALKDSNEAWAAAAPAPGLSPKCPNAAAAAARSYASLCLERGSAASLGDLAFRPPSPIDLRRSIDQALCRQHLLCDGLFGRPRRGSGTSLRAGPQPGSLARCSSLTELAAPRPPPAAAAAATSASSLESSSLHISWNPWRHGLSSPESLPPDEAPSRAPLLARPDPPAAPQPPDSEREARRSFLALSKQVDSRSLSSDTIEL
ncbi:proline-rich transmembrane protein 3 [Apteryx mantelli]|uniref:Proline-rich transmembrane protein 3 n=1 Tax=Apteryx mantelli TaxID=2696672 RepID=A0ABM4F489_9AVES